MSNPFFTELKRYFQCCICKCFSYNREEDVEEPIYTHDSSPYSFDDLTSPSTQVSWSTSTSSLDSFDYQYSTPSYKRKNIRIAIIPSYYYNSD